MNTGRWAKIAGVGMYLPDEQISNADLAQIMDCDVDQYLRGKGIGTRYRAGPNEATSDMAVRAAEQALERAGMGPDDLDLIIVATDTPDYITPPTSAIVQHKLRARNAGSFDLNAACTDETIALATGSHYIMLDPAVTAVLVIGAYGMTKWLDFRPYTESASKVLSMLFSDGAAAVVLTASDMPGYLASKIATDGRYWDTYGIYLGTARPLTREVVDGNGHFLRFHENGHRVPADFNPKMWSRLLAQTLASIDLKPDDLKLLFTNQVDLAATQAALERLGLTMDQTHWVADRFGYAGSASVFMALFDAIGTRRLAAGDRFAICTSGAGFIASTAVFRWV